MRFGVCLLILGGCGRVGFDDAPRDAAQGTVDAAPCTGEGEPCDDGNICTASSSCQAGVCVAPTEIPSCRVASSETEFSFTQGTLGWNYGFWTQSTDPNSTYDAATDYQELAYLDNAWRPPTFEPEPSPNFTWAYLLHWGGHPGTFPEIYVPVRRWVSDVTGRAFAVVSTSKADFGGGDGVRTLVYVDGVEKLTRDVEGTDAVGFTEPVPIDVVVGSTVDVLLHPIGDDAVDSTTMTVVIEARN